MTIDYVNQPPPYTEEEVREMFLASCKHIARYWASVEDPHIQTNLDRCDGVVFSILNILDGMACNFPAAIDLVVRPHNEDKAYRIGQGERWVEDGLVINSDVMLHDLYHKK